MTRWPMRRRTEKRSWQELLQSRRPDSNRRPLHYEARTLLHPNLALHRPFRRVIPYPTPLFRIYSATEPRRGCPGPLSDTREDLLDLPVVLTVGHGEILLRLFGGCA